MEQNGFKTSPSTVAVVPDYAPRKLGKSRKWLVHLLMIGVPILLCGVLVIILMFVSEIPPKVPYTSICLPSAESNRSNLTEVLKKIQHQYFHILHPQTIYKMSRVTPDDIRLTFRPYDPSPNATKNRTDDASELLRELNSLTLNTTLLKMRERKAVHVARAILKNNYGWAPYTQNYYTGDWLLGPDMYCWQPICSVFLNLGLALPFFKPHNMDELNKLRDLFEQYNHTFERYIENLKLGVRTGYVRPQEACKAALHKLFYVNYRNIALGNETGIYKEDFAQLLLSSGFFEHLSEKDNEAWTKRYGTNVSAYFNHSLFENIARPAIKMLRYVKDEHLMNCPESSILSGLGKLPLPFPYINNQADTNHPALQQLPTGEKLNGSTTYQRLMSFFTTLDITPAQLRQKAVQRLNELYTQALQIAKSYTDTTDNATAINRFKSVLQHPNMSFNTEPFPANESGDDAFIKCIDDNSAKAYCPKRWSALKDWVNHTTETMKIIRPSLTNLFYDKDKNVTMPVCPVKAVAWFHPAAGFHSYNPGTKDCKVEATQGLPFFLEKFGPKWTEYTTTAHEQLPGHHLEVHSFIEYFEGDCTDPIHWLSANNFFPGFTEGWTTYIEYQLLPQDTRIYTNTLDKRILLQKYGMIFYQLLAALRAVVDIDLHYYEKTRADVLDMFNQYIWEDRTDFVQKDITRIQSTPGFVTSYMIGQMEISRLRARAERELGRDFSLKDFHYVLLRQGEVPFPYLEESILGYIQCKKDPNREGCDEIL